MKKHTYYSRIIALVMSLLFIVLLGGCGGSKEANNIKKPPKEAKIELDMEVFGLSSITINDVRERVYKLYLNGQITLVEMKDLLAELDRQDGLQEPPTIY